MFCVFLCGSAAAGNLPFFDSSNSIGGEQVNVADLLVLEGLVEVRQGGARPSE